MALGNGIILCKKSQKGYIPEFHRFDGNGDKKVLFYMFFYFIRHTGSLLSGSLIRNTCIIKSVNEITSAPIKILRLSFIKEQNVYPAKFLPGIHLFQTYSAYLQRTLKNVNTIGIAPTTTKKTATSAISL